jgi:hypothetical protein
MDNPLPILPKERRLNADPQYAAPWQLILLPSRTKSRRDKLLPACEKSVTLILYAEAICVIPRTEMVDPHRTNERTDNEEPTLLLSRELNAAPRRTNCRNDNEEPTCHWLNTDVFAANAATPDTETPEANRQKERNDKLLPTAT